MSAHRTVDSSGTTITKRTGAERRTSPTTTLLILSVLTLWALGASNCSTAIGQTPAPDPGEITASRHNAIVNAAERVGPAVVNVTVTQTRIVRERSILDDFWGFYFPPREYRREFQSMGSGVIFSSDGLILTNEHVVHGAAEIKVTLTSGEEYEGGLLGSDEATDLAVIKIGGQNLPQATLGNSDDLLIGEWAVAIGNPFGYLLDDPNPTVTAGVISALNRDIKREASEYKYYRKMIQTDAAINPGNSGGPLVNAAGEVVGINTFIFTSSRGSEGVGFAIPINRAKAAIRDLLEYGEVVKPWIGAHVQGITPMLAQSLGLPVRSGVIVADLETSSPAEKAGLRRGDIILRVGTEKISHLSDWELGVTLARAGEEIELEIWRGGETERLTLLPERSPIQVGDRPPDKLGLVVDSMNRKIASHLGLESSEGVIILAVQPDSPAHHWGLEKGDVIRRIGRYSIKDLEEYQSLLKRIQPGSQISLLIDRRGRLFFMTVQI
jgi:serine protease Do